MKEMLGIVTVALMFLSLETPASAEWHRTFCLADTVTVGKGHLQVDGMVDYLQWADDTGNTWTVRPALRYGVLDNLDLVMYVPYFKLSPAYGDSESGLGDTTVSAKYRLLNEASAPLDLSSLVSVTFPTGDKDKWLGSGGTDVSVRGEIAKTFNKLVLVGNLGYTFVGETNGRDYNNEVEYGAEAIYRLNQDTSLNVVLAGLKERLDRNLLEAGVGATRMVSSNFQITGGALSGLTNDSADYEFIVTFTYQAF